MEPDPIEAVTGRRGGNGGGNGNGDDQSKQHVKQNLCYTFTALITFPEEHKRYFLYFSSFLPRKIIT